MLLFLGYYIFILFKIENFIWIIRLLIFLIIFNLTIPIFRIFRNNILMLYRILVIFLGLNWDFRQVLTLLRRINFLIIIWMFINLIESLILLAYMWIKEWILFILKANIWLCFLLLHLIMLSIIIILTVKAHLYIILRCICIVLSIQYWFKSNFLLLILTFLFIEILIILSMHIFHLTTTTIIILRLNILTSMKAQFWSFKPLRDLISLITNILGLKRSSIKLHNISEWLKLILLLILIIGTLKIWRMQPFHI